MDDREKKSFEVVYQNAIRIKELIHQLLDISQLENSPERLQVASVDLAQWTGKLAATYAALARKKGIRFKYAINSYSDESWFDADKLEKIISNLLSNAIKYTERTGEVSLSWKQKRTGNLQSDISRSETPVRGYLSLNRGIFFSASIALKRKRIIISREPAWDFTWLRCLLSFTWVK